MNILIVSPFFSPNIQIASFRIDAFARYFREAGHTVTVITRGERDETVTRYGCTVHYLRDWAGNLSGSDARKRFVGPLRLMLMRMQFLCSLDWRALWRRRACAKARELLDREPADVLLTSYSPLAPHMIALRLRKKGYKFHWVADMRDEMSDHPHHSLHIARRLRRVERIVLREADLVTTVSRPLVDQFRRLCGHDRFLEVRNGYDYEEVRDASFQPRFTLGYVGRFYWESRPDNLFEVLAEMKRRGEIPSDFRFRIVGNHLRLVVPEAIRDNVEQEAEVPHDEALAILRQLDVLVMIHPTGRRGVYTGKVFDYLASNKPILALFDPRDVVADLLAETRAGFVADNDDREGVRRKILECHRLWRDREVLPRDWEKIRQYRRKNQVGILLKHLEATLRRH